MKRHHHADFSPPRGRRGVVLILVLGMLALLALIGVTFATFASQSKIGARNFAQTVNAPAAGDLMDYALSQLINDTDNPLSAIRGHGLKRHMYGNDAAGNNILTTTMSGPLYLTSQINPNVYETNISSNGSNLPTGVLPNLVGWILKLSPTTSGFNADGTPITMPSAVLMSTSNPNYTMQTFVVTAMNTSTAVVRLTLSATDSLTQVKDLVTTPVKVPSSLISPINAFNNYPFLLDGRYRSAFNGPGIAGAYPPSPSNLNRAQYANFRFNGGLLDPANGNPATVSTIGQGNPDLVGMDEDYDACDLENWYLAIQSADGGIVVPSFHRPGIVTPNDWMSATPQSLSKILRPRSADHGPNNPFRRIGGVESPQQDRPIDFDVDNDGDGKSDSVWLDLGYPPRRNAQGKLYKPLFAFMVIGLNGRIPLNTAGNLAARSNSGNPQSQHASHLGNSVSEVDPTYALQNALYNALQTNPNTGNPFGQGDDAQVDVRTTQLRNLLAGTRPIPPEILPRNPSLVAPGVGPSVLRNFGDLNYAPIGVDSAGYLLRYYMPNSVVDTSDRNTNGGVIPTAAAADAAAVRRDAVTPTPIPGRFGEAAAISGLNSGNSPFLRNPYNNPPRAGYSLGDRDSNDDNLNTFDYYGVNGASHLSEVNDSDYYDASFMPVLPVERMRRFVTPVDLDGSGRIRQWPGTSNTRLGSDAFGRLAFLGYFRPPGLPGRLNAAGRLTPRAQNEVAIDATQPPSTIQGNNPFHGYDFHRFPALANADPSAQQLGGMPTNTPADANGNPIATTGTSIPTYDNSSIYGLQTVGQNEADELNLYTASHHDAPFGPSDLEWLYRYHDVDGASLSSRLSQLAPISFTNSAPIVSYSFDPLAPVQPLVLGSDSLRRRRLFSIDSWELNRAAWANDNPQNVSGTTFVNNSRFLAADNAGFAKLQSNTAWRGTSGPLNPDPLGTGPFIPPSLLHGDRKINLNHPLPISNDPIESVRQKWIRETYVTLKSILPPLAVDTPEELAQLSQFVVNIIDFRDPDCTMTRFVNTDVTVTAGSASTAPVLTLSNPATVTDPYSPTHNQTGENYLVQFGMEYNPIALNEVLAYSFIYNNGGTKNAPTYARNNRFFVELVNTLTDSSAKLNPGDPASTLNPSWLNLGGNVAVSTDPYKNGTWDLIFTADDPISRPDPYTGQLINPGGNYYSMIPLNGNSFTEGARSVPPLPRGDTPNTNTANPLNYYFVIGNAPAANATAMEPKGPAPGNQASFIARPSQSWSLKDTIDPLTAGKSGAEFQWSPGILPGNPTTKPGNYHPNIPTEFPLLGSNSRFDPKTASQSLIKFYWVCLRRPANPFAEVSATNPMVVVDSVRFPYTDAMGSIDASNSPMSPPTIVPADGYLAYSVQRWQPYRGGHAVPFPGGSAKDWRYGYSEQIIPPLDSVGTGATANPTVHQGFLENDQTQQATRRIYHSLGDANQGRNTPPNPDTEPWYHFAFNDRDFTSVAELLLVPGCSPGLFTKQFIEFDAQATNESVFTAAPLSDPRLATQENELPMYPLQAARTLGSNVHPASRPYLVDKFYYSAASPASAETAMVDNATSGGWYKMFEFFEVPSQSHGATGPVAQGANFDWFRQDLKPGLINLNLIIDEEVFLSVMGQQSTDYEQRLLDFTQLNGTRLNDEPNPELNVATGLGANGIYSTHNIMSVGTFDGGDQNLKASFIRFLKLRHGGSRTLFGFGSGVVGTPNAADRPFRSLSYPDINQTIMRPASLPPSASSARPLQIASASGYTGDPGLKNPFRYPGYASGSAPTPNAIPPATPARRLFQIPDSEASSNASANAVAGGDAYINTQTTEGGLVSTPADTTPPNLTSVNLGGGSNDRRQQPAFRTEMLQKVMNLTTVRTHQYAVWITVGFFEVTRPGNPELVDVNPALAYDQLGREIGLNGKRIRYRGFYVVDRTRATGFNPADPGDYRHCVLSGHVIQ